LEFAIEAFKTFLPQISEQTLKKAWSEARQAFSHGEIESLYNDKDFSEADKLQLILSVRRMLGKLVLFDTRSAANQDPKVKRPFRDALPAGPIYKQRPGRKYGQNRLSALRDSLKDACLSMAPGLFYSIEAPTGTGKTEAMLSLAEKVACKENKKAIVYAVPQISICEQIVADY
jgi:CRISPR/Cas system-associated endonuclease/helicase Cas3